MADLMGTTITAAQVAQWKALGLTDDQISDSIEYNRKYTQDRVFQQAEVDRLAQERAVKTAADANIRSVQAEVARIVQAGTAAAAGQVIPGATVQEVIDNFPIDYAAAAEAVRRLEPSLRQQQAEANVKAVTWNQQPALVDPAPAVRVITGGDVVPTVAVVDVPTAPAPVGAGAPNYTDPAQAAAAAANDTRLANDPGFVAAEIERTLQVLIQREAAGLDCTAQNAYLDRLEAAQRGTPWLVTGPQQQEPTGAPVQAGLFGGLTGWPAYVILGVGLLLALIYGR